MFFVVLGLTVAAANLYRISASGLGILIVSFLGVAVTSAVMLYVERKPVLCTALSVTALWLLLSFKEVSLFRSHMMHILESRLLSTAARASHSSWELAEHAAEIGEVYLVICGLFAVFFSIVAHTKHTGVIATISVLTFVPAFGAEIMTFQPGMDVMIMGLFGLYAIWAAHAWESTKGKLKLSESPKVGTSKAKNSQPDLSSPDMPKGANLPKYPPVYYRHSTNALIVVVIVGVSLMFAQFSVKEPVYFDYKAVWGATVSVGEALNNAVSQVFTLGKSGIFSGGSGDISMGIHPKDAPSGTTPVVRVTMQHGSHRIFLRSGIGIDFLGDTWSVTQDSPAFKQLQFQMLIDGFEPALEYHAFNEVMKARNADVESIRTHEYFKSMIEKKPTMANHITYRKIPVPFARQRVTVDYLTRTSFLLLPTEPYDMSVVSSREFTRYGDSYIRPDKHVRTTAFDVLYPRMHRDYVENGVYFGDFGLYDWEFPEDVNADWGVFFNELNVYRTLISHVYAGVPDDVKPGIDLFVKNMGFGLQYPAHDSWGDNVLMSTFYADGDSSYLQGDWFLIDGEAYTQYAAAKYVESYLKSNYAYSLDTDNTNGPHPSAISNFLYANRKGHCALFASSMTLAMRHLGLPARYVTGIVTESIATRGDVQEFAERDFHAWCEVYIAGMGWIPFDPTGGVRGELRALPDDDEFPYEDQPTPEATSAPEPEVTSAPVVTSAAAAETTTAATEEGGGAASPPVKPVLRLPSKETVMLVVMLLVWCGAVTYAVVFVRRVRRRHADRWARFRAVSDSKTAEEMYRHMFDLLQLQGLGIAQGELPLDFGRRVDAEFPLGDGALLEKVMCVFEKLQFGGEKFGELSKREYALVLAYLDALNESVVESRKKPLRFLRLVRLR